jgi:hypothetical protein
MSTRSALWTAIHRGVPCDLGPIDATKAADAEWDSREISASDLHELIEKASDEDTPFLLNGAHVRGLVRLGAVKITVPISLTSCWLDEGVDLDFASTRDLDLTGSRIGVPDGSFSVSGRLADVQGDLCIAGSAIEAGCRLCEVTIKGSLSARRATIDPFESQDPAAIARWAVNLQNGSIAGDLTLEQVQMKGGLNLAGTTINGQVNLIGAWIAAAARDGVDDAHLRASEYTAVYAQRCEIGESVLANPHREPDFETHARFDGCVSLLGAKVTGSVNFRCARFERATHEPPDKEALDLFLANMDSLNLDGAINSGERDVDLGQCTVRHFVAGDRVWRSGKYRVDGFHYESVRDTGRLRRRWLNRSKDHDRPGPYLTLAAAAAKSGESSNELKAKIRASSKASNMLERLLLSWVRYGYRPYFVAIPLALLLFATFHQVAVTRRNANGFAPVVVDSKSINPSSCKEVEARCLDDIQYALDALIPIDLKQVATWRPNRSTHDGNQLEWLLTVDKIASWVLAGVFIAAIAGKLKRT